MTRVLVIRLGALGDFVLSFPAFADIRAHHGADKVTLLTTAPFVSLALDSPWFDQVRVDDRPSWLDPAGVWRLRRQLRGFDVVYDLQTSSRSSRYFWLAGRPAWSGIARGASMPHDNPRRNDLHTVARQRDQLAQAGVPASAAPDLRWLAGGGPVLETALCVAGAGHIGGAWRRQALAGWNATPRWRRHWRHAASHRWWLGAPAMRPRRRQSTTPCRRP